MKTTARKRPLDLLGYPALACRVLTFSALLLAGHARGQLSVASQSNIQQLASAITGPGVTISNPVITCHALGYGEYSYSGTGMDLTEGVILTSGRITDAIGPNNNTGTSNWFAQNTTGDPLLDAVTGRSTRDACKFEFDIIPTGDSLRFEFTFGSEEYNEWVGSQYNDVFGFYISGPGVTGDPGAGGQHNIALIPGTSTAVTINNVNNGSNATYYHDNTGGSQTQYDGYTTGLVARTVVQPCQSYHLKLVVADASDRKYDSGVFIEKIVSPTVTMQSFTVNGTPHMVEGCNPGWVRFTRSSVEPAPMSLQYYISGSATNGSDYTAIGNVNPAVAKTIVIPAGQASVDRPVDPLVDAFNEPVENLRFILGNPNCPSQPLDSLIFELRDTIIATVTPPNGTICSGGSMAFNIAGGVNYAWSPATGLSCTTCPNPVASPATTTTYTVSVNEGLCSRTFTRQVRVSNLTLPALATHPLCLGASNGAINVTPTGGLAPFTYAWTGPGGFTANTQDISNIPAGTYTLTTTDAACTRTQSWNVIDPAVLSVSLNPAMLPFGQHIACNGGATGSINSMISGGTPPYTTTWSGPGGFTSGSPDISNLSAGSYSITVIDVNGCTATASVTLTESPAINFSASTTSNVLCFGSNIGAASSTISGGIPPYSFSWNSTPVQTTQNASGLAPGTYTVTLTDSYNCTATANVSIGGPGAPLSTTLTAQTNVLCFGNSTGSAGISISGGTSPYSTTWNTTPVQNGTLASDLPAGTWTATVTDANGCQATRNVTITQPATALTASLFARTNVLCFGNNTGSATVSAAGGTGPYTYQWNTVPAQNTATANNLPAGSYTCTVRDVNLCATTVNVAITQPAAALSTSIAAQTDVLCFGNSTGSATINVNGGTAPYTYSWNTAPVQNTATAGSLPAGTWTCTVTDDSGCTTTRNVTITQPAAALNGSITAQTNVLCFGNSTGSATVSVSGGTSPYTYTWNSTPAQNTATASGLPAGTYSCTIADANGCSIIRNVTITQPAAALSASLASQTHVLCFGNNTGSAGVTVSGGTAPYSYSWNTSPVQTGANASGLVAGSYTCAITDANGCASAVNVTITQPAATLSTSIAAQTDVLCFGNSTGSATINVNGGTAPYTYSWNTAPVQNTATAGSLPAGTWTCTVTDANGCIVTRTITITQPAAALSMSGSITPASCGGSATGAVDASVSGGTAPYTYSWSGPSGFTAGSQDISALEAGAYTLTVTDANGCTAAMAFSVTQPGFFTITGVTSAYLGGWQVSCSSANDGSIAQTISGGTAPYTMSWTGPGGFTSTGEDLSGLIAGTYLFTLTDANGCSTSASYALNAPTAVIASAISPTVIGGTHISCAGAFTGIIDGAVSGGTTPYTFAWNGPGGYSSAVLDNISLGAGSYTLVATDANGCVGGTSITLIEPAPLAATVGAQTNVGCHGAATGSASVNVIGGTAGYSYAWNTTPSQTSATALNLVAGIFTCTITDANGCSTTQDVTITEPAATLDASITAHTDVLIFGQSTGSATVSVTGGTAPFAWSWTDGQTSATATGLAAGTYGVTVTDANGCTATTSVSITQPGSALSAAITGLVPVDCFGSSTGSATISANGGTAPYSFTWNTGPVQNTATATNLPAGTYICTVTDSHGATTAVSVVIAQPAAMLSSSIASQTDVDCFGNNTGSASVNAIGGTPAYVMSWNTTPVQSGASAVNLAAGVHTCTITDANGCTTSQDVTIAEPGDPLAAGIGSMSHVDCFGNSTGSAEASVTGGTAPFDFSWNTSTPQNSASATGLAAGMWTCTITDAHGCTISVDAIIDQPSAALSASIASVTQATCGNNNGTATAAVAGGTAPYNYSWDSTPAQNGASLTGMAAGTYTCTITDANGCGTNAVATITSPGGLALSLLGATPQTCFGTANGQASVAASGGNMPYTILWNTVPAQNGATASGLLAGTYTATVHDADGCSSSLPVTIDGPSAPLSLTIASSTDVLCFGGNTGAASVNTIGGLAPYSITWNTSPAQNGASATDLPAGTYTATAIDAFGCSSSVNVLVQQPVAPVDGYVDEVHHVSCFGGNDGFATIEVIGGSGSWTIDWNTTPPQSGTTATGLAAGLYFATITDANGCNVPKLVPVTITEPAAPLAHTAVSSDLNGFGTSCSTTIDGSIHVTTTGGTPGYAFSWTGPNGFTASTEDLNGLAPGPYTLAITDANGCSDGLAMTISAPPAVTATAGVTTVVCNGSNTGALDVTASGGVAPYTYAWSGPNGYAAVSEDIANIGPGVYEVAITDANGCTVDQFFSVSEPGVFDITAVVSSYTGGANVSCANSSDGAIDVTATGGTAPYTFAWSGPGGFASNTEDVSGIGAGTYSLSLVDANGCGTLEQYTLTAPAQLFSTLSPFTYPSGGNMSCAGESDGAIDATIGGGTPAYQFSWTGPNGLTSNAEDISALQAGNYTLTVTDINGCTVAQSISLTSPTAVSASYAVSQYNSGDAVSCHGGSNGIIDLAISGGLPPYNVSWTGPNGFTSTDHDISGLTAGVYDAMISDAAGCDTTLSVTLTEPAPVVASGTTSSFNGSEVSCHGSNDGSIDVTPSGGAGNFIYQWTGPNAFVSTSQDVSGLEAGIYDVIVNDMNGCKVLLSFTLDAPQALAAAANITNADCQGAADGAIDLTVSGGTPGYAVQWNGPGGFNAITEDLAALFSGIYTVSITDANGCALAQPFDVNEPGQFSISGTTTTWPGGYGVSCAGSSDGGIEVTASGGTAPLYFAWSGPNGYSAITEDISGLEAGTYALTLTDSNGCSQLQSWTITSPTPIQIGLSPSQFADGSSVACSGGSNASIDATIIGGVAPYAISWTGPGGYISISEDLSGLPAGTYTLNVTDAIGCTASSSITLTEPPPISLGISTSQYMSGGNISCNGSIDGAIDITVSGGSLLYLVHWTGPNGFVSNNADISGLAAGNYNVTITDANGCTASASVNLIQPDPILIDLSLSQFGGGYAIGCNGATGNVDAFVQGGAVPWTYLWTGPDGFTSNAQDLSGIPAGTYDLLVTDAAGCTSEASVTLDEPTAIDVTATLSSAGNGYHVGCAGNDGSISLDLDGGLAPYTTDWSGPNGFASLSEDLTGLSAGTYQLMVTDVNGCQFQQSFTLTQAAMLTLTSAVTGNVCDGLDDGAVDLTIMGGVAPFAIHWNGPNNFSSNSEDISALTGGTYSVDVTDANGCGALLNATIAASTPIDLDLYLSDYGGVSIPCAGGNTGVIEATIQGGAGLLDILWSGPAGFSSNAPNLNGLAAGQYQLSIIDENGCSLDTVLTLTEPTSPLDASLSAAVQPSGTNVSCFGGNDGSVDLSVTGGTGPYDVTWHGPGGITFDTEDIGSAIAGYYDVVISDANGCSVTDSITLSSPDSALTVVTVLSQYNGGYNTSCDGSSDGSILLSVSGGNGTYQYAWSGPGGFMSTEDSLSGLVEGSYEVIVTDLNGCTFNGAIDLVAPTPITWSFDAGSFSSGTNISCYGSSDGSISTSVNGGSGTYTVQWTGPGGFTAADPELTGLAAGQYCVTITDANNCSASDCITLSQPDPLSVTATGTQAACGQGNGSIDASVTGGSAPFTYLWSNAEETEDIAGLPSGNYELVVTDANGCTASTEAQVAGGPALSFAWNVADVLCHGGSDGAIDLTLQSGTAPFAFDWTGTSSGEDLTGLPAGGYQVTVTDANNCTWNEVFTIHEPDPLNVDSELSAYADGHEVSAFGANDGSIELTVSGGTPPYVYDWSTGGTTAELSGLIAGNYAVTVTDANGCTVQLAFELSQPTTFEMPTGFTPNGDGQNDVFVIHGLDTHRDNQLIVFNRWGNVVFEQINYRNDWQGVNQEGEQLPNGTYFVLLRLGSEDLNLQGYVDLRR